MAHRSACSKDTEDSEWGSSESSELEWRGSSTPNLFAGSHSSRETEATSPQAPFSSYTHQGLAEGRQGQPPQEGGGGPEQGGRPGGPEGRGECQTEESRIGKTKGGVIKLNFSGRSTSGSIGAGPGSIDQWSRNDHLIGTGVGSETVDWEGLESSLDQDLRSLLSPSRTSPIHSLPDDLSSYLDLENQYDTVADYLSEHSRNQQENCYFDFDDLGNGVDLVYPCSGGTGDSTGGLPGAGETQAMAQPEETGEPDAERDGKLLQPFEAQTIEEDQLPSTLFPSSSATSSSPEPSEGTVTRPICGCLRFPYNPQHPGCGLRQLALDHAGPGARDEADWQNRVWKLAIRAVRRNPKLPNHLLPNHQLLRELQPIAEASELALYAGFSKAGFLLAHLPEGRPFPVVVSIPSQTLIYDISKDPPIERHYDTPPQIRIGDEYNQLKLVACPGCAGWYRSLEGLNHHVARAPLCRNMFTERAKKRKLATTGVSTSSSGLKVTLARRAESKTQQTPVPETTFSTMDVEAQGSFEPPPAEEDETAFLPSAPPMPPDRSESRGTAPAQWGHWRSDGTTPTQLTAPRQPDTSRSQTVWRAGRRWSAGLLRVRWSIAPSTMIFLVLLTLAHRAMGGSQGQDPKVYNLTALDCREPQNIQAFEPPSKCHGKDAYAKGATYSKEKIKILQKMDHWSLGGWLCKGQVWHQVHHCGMLSHESLVAPPRFAEDFPITPDQCKQATQGKSWTGLDGVRYDVDNGDNVFSYLDVGELYLDHGEVSCQGADTVIDGVTFHGVLRSVQQTVTIQRIKMQKRFKAPKDIHVLDLHITVPEYLAESGDYAVIGEGTILFDHDSTPCNLAALKEAEVWVLPPSNQDLLDGREVGPALLNVDARLRLQLKGSYNSMEECNLEDYTLSRTNYESLVVLRRPPDELPLALLDLDIRQLDHVAYEGIQDDVLASYIEQARTNLTTELSEVKCISQINDHKNNGVDLGEDERVLLRGEVVYRYTCKRVRVSPNPLTDKCYKDLPVLLQEKNKPDSQLFLQAESRQLVKSSAEEPCDAAAVAPRAYRTDSGVYVALTPELVTVPSPILRSKSKAWALDLDNHLDMSGSTKGNLYSSRQLSGWQHLTQWPTFKDASEAHRHLPVTSGASSSHGYDHRGYLDANPVTILTDAVKTYLGNHILELGSICGLVLAALCLLICVVTCCTASYHLKMDRGLCRNVASLLASTCCLPIYLLISLHTQIKHLQTTGDALENDETEHRRPLMTKVDDSKDTPEAKLAVFLTKSSSGDDKTRGKRKKKRVPNH